MSSPSSSKFKVILVYEENKCGVLLPKNISYVNFVRYVRTTFNVEDNKQMLLSYNSGSNSINIIDDYDVDCFLKDVLESDINLNILLFDEHVTHQWKKNTQTCIPTTSHAHILGLKTITTNNHGVKLAKHKTFDDKEACMDVTRVYRPKDISNDLNIEYNFKVSYKRDRKVKQLALESNQGCPIALFAQLPYYCYNLKLANENMVTHIETDNEGCFKMLFIGFGVATMFMANLSSTALIYDEAGPSYDLDTLFKIFWSDDLLKIKAKALKENAKSAKPITTMTVIENEKGKQHYKELYDSIKLTHAKTIEKTTCLINEIENLKAQLKEKMKCATVSAKKQKVLTLGVKGATSASGSKPKSNTKKDKTLPAKSAMKKVEDHHRSNKLFKTYDGGLLRDREFCKKFIRTVRFKNDHFCAIMGYEDYVIGDSVISEDFNGVDLIKGNRRPNLYTISMEDMMKSSPICLLSKASKNGSWLWHRRLNHLNFGTINDLA
uniref:Transposase, MuDR, MULE transposase domain protein n=1 Tax=Tanacetum cinerariifolium TaxID=118510 RepID=A0A6L2JLP9_TANCI|nr:transposase, MuDR, MULE transposase domain protein [Tanacetum cinerariifolium]